MEVKRELDWGDRTLRALGILAFLSFVAVMQMAFNPTVLYPFDNLSQLVVPFLWALLWTHLAYGMGARIHEQPDEYQQREGSAEDTFERLIQQQWDAGEKRLKEIIVAISAFGNFGGDALHTAATMRWSGGPSTPQAVDADLTEFRKLMSSGFAVTSLVECLWKESVTLVALLSRCADESARCGHDVTAKREFIAKVQPKIESLGEDSGWRA